MRNEVPAGPISMGLLEAQSRHGWTNYSLFLRDDGRLIGCVETPDGEAASAGMADVPVNARWRSALKDDFESLEGVNPDEAMRPFEEVFHLS